MNPNFVGSILARSSLKIVHLLSIRRVDTFGELVSEQKIILEINQPKTRIACGGHVC
jgi:hypothetical protein